MNNWKKVAAALSENGLDAALLISPENRLYATGFQSSAGQALVTKNALYFLTDFRYIEAAEASISGGNIFLIGKNMKYSAKINELISELNIKHLGYEDKYLPVSQWDSLDIELHAQLETFSGALSDLRASKEDWEIERIRTAQQISERALKNALKIIKPGMSERELMAEIIYNCYKEGADKLSFDPIVVSGANSSLPHGLPADKKIETGDFVTMDFGCVYRGYCSDMTRTIAVGYATEEMTRIYEIVSAAQDAGIAAAHAGVVGSEIDRAGRNVIERAGYGGYFGHSFGHGLGIEVHESPNASPNENSRLPLQAVITAEPGIYIPGKFGVRIEDMLVLRHSGCENLTGFPRELIIV